MTYFNILIDVNARRDTPMKWFTKKIRAVTFCDECSTACDASCCTHRLRDRALVYGKRFA